MEVAEVLRILTLGDVLKICHRYLRCFCSSFPALRQVRLILGKNIHKFCGAGTLKSRFVIRTKRVSEVLIGYVFSVS